MLTNGNTAIEGLPIVPLGAASATCGMLVTRLDAHWLGDVLQALGTKIVEIGLDLALNVVIGRARYHDAARFGERFQATGDVDALANRGRCPR